MREFSRILLSIFFSIIITGLFNTANLFAYDSSITIYYDKDIGPVNKHIFGSALEGWDHGLVGKKGAHPAPLLSNYGEGVWDPGSKKTVKEVIGLAKNAGLSSMRFTTTNFYKWKRAIGKNRTEFLFGVDEFMQAVVEIGAEPIFTIGYKLEDPQDAADLVEYLNAPDDGNHPWAARRAANGHPAPYGVKYFEIGNEVFNPNLNVTAEEYALKYLQYYESMKSVDPSVQIGVVLEYAPWYLKVLQIIQDRVDFGITHFYPGPPGIGASDEKLKAMEPSEIFSASLAVPVVTSEFDIQQTLKHLKHFAGKDVPLVITEHNGRFAQDDPVPYRHALGTALINAELLRIFMKPENKVLMANNHHFVDGYWGMIKVKGNIMKHDYRKPLLLIKRPIYLVYELYNKHFGDILLQNSVEGESYNIQGKTTAGRQMIDQLMSDIKGYLKKHLLNTEVQNDNLSNTVEPKVILPYLSVNTSKSSDGRTVHIMVINKNMHDSVNTTINIKGFSSHGAEAWVLNGPSVDATNEIKEDTVRISHKTININDTSFSYTFEPHSLTAIEITRTTE